MALQTPQQNNITTLPLEVSLIVSQRNRLPCLEIRRVTTDQEIIKAVISCAFHGKPIIVLPVFNNKIRSLNSLIEKGIIYEKEGQYYFTF